MKSRCTNPADPAYKNYGGKGIKYDPTWETLTGFYADMGDSWFPGGTIDRIDSAGNYEKKNCRWIPLEDQTTVGRQRLRYNNKSGVKGVEVIPSGYRVIVRERGKPRNEGKKKIIYHGKSFEEACRIRKAWEDEQSLIPASSLKR